MDILGQLHIEFHGDDGGGTFNVDVGPVADAILSRYNLEPKDA